MKRFLIWLLVNSAYLASIYVGLVEGVVGMWRVALTMTIVLFVSHLAVLNPTVLHQVRKQDPSAPLWLEMSVHAVAILAFVWYGHGITATMAIISAMIHLYVFNHED